MNFRDPSSNDYTSMRNAAAMDAPLRAFTRYSRMGASSRVRLLQFLPALRALGVTVEVNHLLGDDYLAAKYSGEPVAPGPVVTSYINRLSRLLRARRHVVWLEKEALPYIPFHIERALLGRYIVDIDDAWYLSYSASSSGLVRATLSTKIQRLLAGSSLVIAGNSYLSDYATSLGATWCEVVPSVVDCARYAPTQQPVGSKARLVVGWIGSPATQKYLSIVLPSLQRLARVIPLELHVVGGHAPATDGLMVRQFSWSEDSEVTRIQGFDIGIMPLADGEWERGKCAYKLVQYMATGLPVVASKVGANREVVRDGVDGYLVQDASEWEAAIVRLADASLRASLGANARVRALQDYSIQSQAPRLAELFRLRSPSC